VQAQDLLYGNAGLVKSITKLEDKTSLIQSGITFTQSVVTVDSTKIINSQISKKEQTTTETKSFWEKYKWYFINFIIGGMIIVCLGLFAVYKNKKFKLII